MRKHRDIKNCEQYISLDTSLNFGNMCKMKITCSEPKYYLGRSSNMLITSLGIKTIRRSKNIKIKDLPLLKSVLDISKIVTEFKDVLYEGCVRNRYKHMPTDIYLFLAIRLANCMMSNFCGPKRTQNMSTQNMINYKMSRQNMSNFHVSSRDESGSKR